MSTFNVRNYGGSVYAMFTHNRRHFKVSTGIRVPEQYWVNNKVSSQLDNYKELQESIDATLKKLMDAVMRVRYVSAEPTVDQVRREYYKPVEVAADTTPLLPKFLEYIDYKEPIVSWNSWRNIKTAYRILKDFETSESTRIYADNLDPRMFERFIRFMVVNRKLMDNTVGKHVKMIKTFLKWAYPDREFRFITYRFTSHDNIIHLREEELQQLIDAPLSGALDRTRDLLLFSSLTGMRYSDIQRFKPSWVDRLGVLDFRMQKTGGRATPPLFKAAASILEKYGNKLPQISRQKYSDHLKELFTLMEFTREVVILQSRSKRVKEVVRPLNEVVSSHIGRKTFVSLALSKGIPIQDVMKMSGHSDYKSMKPYIEVSKSHLREVSRRWEI